MMKHTCILITLSLGFIACHRQVTTGSVVYSRYVKDSFEIFISTPPSFDSGKTYDVVYYCDANLKSGKLLRKMISDPQFGSKANKTIFVGIGHIGNYRELRRRDLIPPHIENGDTIPAAADHGQAEKFYQFLEKELMPRIDSSFHTNRENNTIAGHSLGGLFVFYALFKNDPLFANYYALSPSLWIDYYSIYRLNRLDQGITKRKNLYFSAGGLERFNRIKAGADEMNDFLQKKQYPNLYYTYQVHRGKTHNSQVEKSFEYLLTH